MKWCLATCAWMTGMKLLARRCSMPALNSISGTIDDAAKMPTRIFSLGSTIHPFHQVNGTEDRGAFGDQSGQDRVTDFGDVHRAEVNGDDVEGRLAGPEDDGGHFHIEVVDAVLPDHVGQHADRA